MKLLSKYLILLGLTVIQFNLGYAQNNEQNNPNESVSSAQLFAYTSNDEKGGEKSEIGNAPLESDTGMMILEGTYQGKNIYVNNPSNAYETDFAVFKVTVNGKKIYNFASSNFVIDLTGNSIGNYVRIEISYKAKGYPPPQILNGGVIRSRSSFELIDLDVTEGNIIWSTRNENSQEPYIIERDVGSGLWSDWVVIGSVVGKGSKIYNEYKFAVNHFSGENNYRIKQRDGLYQYSYLPPIRFISAKPPVTLAENRVKAKLKLSERTEFEIFDTFGRLITKGKGKIIDVSGIKSGTYFIKIDNKTDTFVKN